MGPGEQTTGAVIARTLPGVGEYMCGLTWDGALLWHSDQEARKVFAIDPADGTVVRELRCNRVRADLGHDGTSLLVVGGRPKRIVLVDPGSGETSGEKEVLPASGRLTGIEMGPEGLWMCLRGPTVVQLRNYTTMEIEREYPVGGESPSGLTYADGKVIHGDFDDAILRVTDARTGAQLGSLRAPGRPTGMSTDGKYLWYCDFAARAFRAIDLETVLTG